MKSRNGVYYDLEKSEYRLTVDGLTFVFSSRLHLKKFQARRAKNKENINHSLSKRFNLFVDVAQLADIVLYRKIESRGFLIVTNEGIKLCQKSVKYVGGTVTPLNSNGQ